MKFELVFYEDNNLRIENDEGRLTIELKESISKKDVEFALDVCRYIRSALMELSDEMD